MNWLYFVNFIFSNEFHRKVQFKICKLADQFFLNLPLAALHVTSSETSSNSVLCKRNLIKIIPCNLLSLVSFNRTFN